MEKTVYDEITENIEKFCNSVPVPGFEFTYLYDANKLYKLYCKASGILEYEYDIEKLKCINTEIEEIISCTVVKS